MAAARTERPAALRLSIRYSRLELALAVLAVALAALAIAGSRLADSSLAWTLWALLALAGGIALRAPGRCVGAWLFDQAPDGSARLRPASEPIDSAPVFVLCRRTCWPFLLVVYAVDVASGERKTLVVMVDALGRDEFRRLAAWLRRARCGPDGAPG